MLHVERPLRNFRGRMMVEMYILYVSTESLLCLSDIFVTIVCKHVMEF